MNKSKLEEHNDELSKIYDEVTEQPKYSWVVPKKVFKYIRDYLNKDSRVLDLGVGTGQTIKPVSEITNNIVAVDISEEMINKAKRKVSSAEFYKIDLNEDFISLDSKFDLVIAAGITEFIENIEFFLKNVSRSLDSDGLFCFTFELNKNNNQGNKALPSIESSKKIPFKIFRRSDKDIRYLLDKYNFKEIRSEFFTGYFKYVNDKKIPIPYKIILAKKI